jgi:O-antigen/teichoic acid export membrane protein
LRLRDLVLKLTRQASIYGMGEMAGRLAGFLLIPVYTALLTREDFGRLQILLSLHMLGQMTADLGFTAAYFRWYGLARTEEERRFVLNQVAAGTLLAILLFDGLFFLGARSLAQLLLRDPVYTRYVQIVGVSFGLRVLATLAYSSLRLWEKPKGYAALSVGRTLLSLSLVLFFVVVGRLGVWGVLLGETVANAAACLVAFWLLGPHLGGVRVSPETWRGYLAYGFPIVLANFGAFALVSTDKMVLSAKGLAVETGLYALGGKLGVALNVAILWPFTLVWTPTMFRIAREETPEEARRLFSRIFTYMAALLLWAGLALALWAPEVIDLVSPPAYQPAARVAPLLVLAYVIYGAYRHFQVGLNVSGRSRSIAGSFLAAALVNLGLNLLLIPLWGMMGAAAATVLSYALMAGLVLVGSQRTYRIPYEWGRVLRLALWAGLLFAAGWILWPHSGWIWPGSLLKLLLVAAFPAGALAMRILTPGERRALLGAVSTLRSRGGREEPPPWSSD